MQLSSFMISRTWKLSKVLKTFGSMKSKATLIPGPSWSSSVTIRLFRQQGRPHRIKGSINRKGRIVRQAEGNAVFRDISENCRPCKRLLHDSYICAGQVAVENPSKEEAGAQEQYKFRQFGPAKQTGRRMLRLLN